jgi:hypothetical protein
MQFLIEPMRCLYIEKYPIQSLFSFPITPHIQVCQFERGEFIFKEKHTEVCEYLGVSYRHLLHVLAQLCDANIIEKQSRCYKIRDKARLAALAKEV